jgi:hypothetical protein
MKDGNRQRHVMGNSCERKFYCIFFIAQMALMAMTLEFNKKCYITWTAENAAPQCYSRYLVTVEV